MEMSNIEATGIDIVFQQNDMEAAASRLLRYCTEFGKFAEEVETIGGYEPENTAAESIVSIRETLGMTRKQFCDYLEIPYRTIQDWELGNRHMPKYLLRLLAYRAGVEKIIKREGGHEYEETKPHGGE